MAFDRAAFCVPQTPKMYRHSRQAEQRLSFSLLLHASSSQDLYPRPSASFGDLVYNLQAEFDVRFILHSLSFSGGI